jgi:hypothetical protein
MVMDGRLVLRDCSLYQYGVFGTADCNECPNGATHCRGGDASTCFNCDGKTRMNVTARLLALLRCLDHRVPVHPG